MKRFKLVVPSFIAIIFCMLLIAGSTFALFTSEASAEISVTSGKVKVSAQFKDDSLKVYSAKAVDAFQTTDDIAGEIEASDLNANESWANYVGKYIFDEQNRTYVASETKTYHLFANNGTDTATGALLENNKLTLKNMTPGDKVKATLSLVNGSNVAIKYRVKVNLVSGLKLFEGLQIKLDGVLLQGVSKVGTWTYLEAPANDTNGDPIDNMDDINVEVILPLKAGNKYQDLTTVINFTVEAVQGNAATTNETLNTNINAEQEVETVASVTEITGQTIKDSEELVTVTVPAAALAQNETYANAIMDADTTTSLSVKVEPQDTVSDLSTVVTSEQTAQSYDLEVLVTTQTTGQEAQTEKYNKNNSDQAAGLTIQMFVGTGLKGVELYHGTEKFTKVDSLTAVDEVGEFYYDETTGHITLMTNSFSEYTVVYNKDLVIETVDEQTKESTFTTYQATETAGVYTREVEDEVTGDTTTETFAPVKDEDGEIVIDNSGEIQVQTYDAKIGDKHYDTLKAAMSDAKSGDIVELLKDIIVSENNYIYTLGANITIDGNNHNINFVNQPDESQLIRYMYGTLKNVTINGINDILTLYLGFGATFDTVTLNGDINYGSLKNCGGFGAYTYGYSNNPLTFKNCVYNVNMTGSGSYDDYFAAFVGYVWYAGDIVIENCSNKATLNGGRAAMFIGNPSYGNVNANVTIINFKNEGKIVRNYLGVEYNSNQFVFGTTSDFDNFASFTIDGISYSMEQVRNGEADEKVGGTRILGSSSLKLESNDNGTFKVTEIEGAAYYVVGIGMYAEWRQGGSGTYYVTERLEANSESYINTNLVNYEFVDLEWLENHEGAVLSNPSWNENVRMYTLDNHNYYLLRDDLTFRGENTHANLFYVAAFDSNGNLLASVGLSE